MCLRHPDALDAFGPPALGAAGAQFISPNRIALNPDCGFAPGAGEPPTIDETYTKAVPLVAAAQRLRERFAESM